jgi:hypothetical protein
MRYRRGRVRVVAAIAGVMGAALGGGGVASANVLLDPGTLGVTPTAGLTAPLGTHTLRFDTDTGEITLDGATVRAAGGGTISGISEVPNANGTGLTAFVMTSLTVPAGSTVTSIGAAPLALVSAGDISISGVIEPGPASADGSGAGGAGAPQAGGIGGGGGGGFGGAGGAGGESGGSGGPANGTAAFASATAFPTGSSGGPGYACADVTGIAGGAGGGGLELAALGTIDLTGATMNLDGTIPGAGGAGSGGGGGAGGALLIVTPHYVDDATTGLALWGAPGGAAGACVTGAGPPPTLGNGGGGGGGRFELVSSQDTQATTLAPPDPPTYQPGSQNGSTGAAGTTDRQPFLVVGGPPAPALDVPVTFTAKPAIGALQSASWSFGDGGMASTSSGVDFTTHTYVQPGTYTVTVTGTMAGSGVTVSGSSSFTVTDTVSSLSLSPPTESIEGGTSVGYRAIGFDSSGDQVGIRTDVTTFTIAPDGPNTGASCQADLCTAKASGTYTVTGTDGAATGQATLTVQPVPTALTFQCPSDLVSGRAKRCTVTAINDDPATVAPAPTGSVAVSYGAAVSHAGGSCTLAPATASTAQCTISLTPGNEHALPVTLVYAGDAAHIGNTTTDDVRVYDVRFSVSLGTERSTGSSGVKITSHVDGPMTVSGQGISHVNSFQLHAGIAKTVRLKLTTSEASHVQNHGHTVTITVTFTFAPSGLPPAHTETKQVQFRVGSSHHPRSQ